VPTKVMAFADPSVTRYSWPHARPYTEADAREGVLRSHMPFKGGRRDTVMFSLLPGEM
jgi:hypothetical protein